jgi:hypothetical protein
VEPPPQNLNILENITAPDTSTATTITTPTTSSTSDTLTINNNTLLPSESDNTDTEPNSTIMTTIVERLEPDGSVPKPAQESMIKELRNVLQYNVWEPIDKTKRITKAIKSLMIAVEKFTAEGIFDKWKGRLAAMGNMLKRKIKMDITVVPSPEG